MPLVMSTFGPSQSSSMTPTPGVASNLLSAEGISAVNLPYVTVGGQVRRADYGKTIAGSLRLNRLMGVVGPVQQQNILQTVIDANIKQYLDQGYTQQGNTLIRSLGGGMAQFININRATGEFNTSVGTDPSYIAQQQQAQQQAQKAYDESKLKATIGAADYLASQATQAAAKGQTSLAQQLSAQAGQAKGGFIGSVATSSAPAVKAVQSYISTGYTGGDSEVASKAAIVNVEKMKSSGKSNVDVFNAIMGNIQPSSRKVADPFPKKAVITHSGNRRIISDTAPNCRMDGFNGLIRVGRYNNNVLGKFLR